MIKLYDINAINEIKARILTSNNFTTVTFVNAFSYYDLSDQMINQIDYFFSDGILLTKLNNFTNRNKIRRTSFDSTSVAYDFFDFFEKNSLRVGLVGAKTLEIQNFTKYISSKFKDLKVALVHCGYFSEGEKDKVICDALKCDVLVVGMGFPFQEDFLLEVKARRLPSDALKLGITCGGFFTQHQFKDYYPKIIDKLELRWLYRIVFTSHVRWKVLKKYPFFICRYIYNALF